jgi:hypothetical protein
MWPRLVLNSWAQALLLTSLQFRWGHSHVSHAQPLDSNRYKQPQHCWSYLHTSANFPNLFALLLFALDSHYKFAIKQPVICMPVPEFCAALKSPLLLLSLLLLLLVSTSLSYLSSGYHKVSGQCVDKLFDMVSQGWPLVQFPIDSSFPSEISSA